MFEKRLFEQLFSSSSVGMPLFMKRMIMEMAVNDAAEMLFMALSAVEASEMIVDGIMTNPQTKKRYRLSFAPISDEGAESVMKENKQKADAAKSAAQTGRPSVEFN